MTDAAAEALAAWNAAPAETPLYELAQVLFGVTPRLRVVAALAALRAVLEVDDPDPEWQRPQAQLAALEAWLRDPDALARVRSCTGAVEGVWNAVAGNTGHPEPTLQCATYAGWILFGGGQPWPVVHALTGAAKALGEPKVRALVAGALEAAG